MNQMRQIRSIIPLLATASLASLMAIANAAEKPVTVYILAGQSNMVGIGQVSGSSSRWGDEFIDPVLSVYEGAYDPSKNYDDLTPIQTVKLESFGGVSPQKYPGGGTQIVRGHLQVKETGIYEFFPGLGESRNAIMHVDGQEVWCQQPGELASQKSIKLDAGKKVPFKAPNALFVVATCGFNGGEGWEPESSAQTIFDAQMAVSDTQKHPKFAGNVASVDTRPFYRSPDQSPRNQSFHYHGNAETYMLVGEAMGKAMVDLKNK